VPATEFALNTVDVATPLTSEVTVFDPANVPEAPLTGGVKVTATPLTGPPLKVLTVATRGAANAVLMAVFCPDPLVTTTPAAAVLVRENTAGLAAPATVAFTT
jgi:hypothetical protein